jgi:hypothetical protein
LYVENPYRVWFLIPKSVATLLGIGITDVTWNEDCPHPPALSSRDERRSKIQKILVPLALWERG